MSRDTAMTRTHWDALHLLATPEHPRKPADLAPLLGLSVDATATVCRALHRGRLAYCFGATYACGLLGFHALSSNRPPTRLAPETLAAHLHQHPEATVDSVATYFGLPARTVRRRLTEARLADLTTHRLLEAA